MYLSLFEIVEAGNLQIPHKEFVNSSKRQYVVTTEETEDTCKSFIV